MATNQKAGRESAPAAVMSPSTPEAKDLEPTRWADHERDQDQLVRESRGGEAIAEPQETAIRTRKKRPPLLIKTTGRKLHLPDDVHDRLWQLSRQRRTTVSAVAADILDNNLPRFKVERED